MECDLAQLLSLIGVSDSLPVPDLSNTVGVPGNLDDAPHSRASKWHRTNDPELRRAVENQAVQLATKHMKALGWNDVTPLGKPFDLVCRQSGSDVEKHVEVKGTTGAGSTVEYTPNEVRHFRTCPAGADLIVVSDISVKVGKKRYTCDRRNPSTHRELSRTVCRSPGKWLPGSDT